VAFYVPLVPFVWAGVDREILVRYGACLASLLASAALFRLLAPSGARRAGIAVVLLQLLPVTVDLYTYGTFSNVFAQAFAFLFLCWWAQGAPGGWPRGALLLGVAGLAHLGVFIFLLLLAPALVWREGGHRGLERSRVLALAVGLGAAILYYASFYELLLGQLPRLLASGPSSSGAAAFLDRLLSPFPTVRAEWGWPAVLLGLVGLRSSLDAAPAFRALFGAGLLALILALVSPLEVRYLYALTPALAAAAAHGTLRLLRTRAGTVLVAILVVAQCSIALPGLVRQRYVPEVGDRGEPV
jgi:hypothetical protein